MLACDLGMFDGAKETFDLALTDAEREDPGIVLMGEFELLAPIERADTGRKGVAFTIKQLDELDAVLEAEIDQLNSPSVVGRLCAIRAKIASLLGQLE